MPSLASETRVNGYGESDYSNVTPTKPSIPDDEPPTYQPKGPGIYGGSFAETLSSAAAQTGADTPEKAEGSGEELPVAPSAGCGAPETHMDLHI